MDIYAGLRLWLLPCVSMLHAARWFGIKTKSDKFYKKSFKILLHQPEHTSLSSVCLQHLSISNRSPTFHKTGYAWTCFPQLHVVKVIVTATPREQVCLVDLRVAPLLKDMSCCIAFWSVEVSLGEEAGIYTVDGALEKQRSIFELLETYQLFCRKYGQFSSHLVRLH